MPMTRAPGQGSVRISACPMPPDAPEIHTTASPMLVLTFSFALALDHGYPAGQQQGDQGCDQHGREQREPRHLRHDETGGGGGEQLGPRGHKERGRTAPTTGWCV